MPRANLTDLTVRSLKEGTYFDAKTPAFGIRVGKLKKTWLVVLDQSRVKTVLGHYPDMALADARLAARKRMVQPTETKPDTVTFADARARYLDEHTGRPGTKKELTRLLTKHFASFDGKSVTAITDRDVQKQIENLSPSEKLHAFRAIRAAFRWFTRPPRRYVPHSPLEGFAPPGRDGRRTRILSDTEIARLLMSTKGQSGAIVRLMLLWGTRRTETLSLRRDWVVDGILTIPAEVTKSARAHTIPILPLAQSVLDTIPNRGTYFFAGERKANSPHQCGDVDQDASADTESVRNSGVVCARC